MVESQACQFWTQMTDWISCLSLSFCELNRKNPLLSDHHGLRKEFSRERERVKRWKIMKDDVRAYCFWRYSEGVGNASVRKSPPPRREWKSEKKKETGLALMGKFALCHYLCVIAFATIPSSHCTQYVDSQFSGMIGPTTK